MDFNKPLRRLEGFVIYTTLLDFIDTFVHEYNAQKKGKEFPSLRVATDMILTLLEDFKNIEINDLGQEDPTDIAEVLEQLGNRLSEYRKQVNDAVLDSRELGLFVDKESPNSSKERLVNNILRAAKAQINKEPEPFLIEKKEDADWLNSVGITHLSKKLILPKKKRKPKNESE